MTFMSDSDWAFLALNVIVLLSFFEFLKTRPR